MCSHAHTLPPAPSLQACVLLPLQQLERPSVQAWLWVLPEARWPRTYACSQPGLSRIPQFRPRVMQTVASLTRKHGLPSHDLCDHDVTCSSSPPPGNGVVGTVATQIGNKTRPRPAPGPGLHLQSGAGSVASKPVTSLGVTVLLSVLPSLKSVYRARRVAEGIHPKGMGHRSGRQHGLQ